MLSCRSCMRHMSGVYIARDDIVIYHIFALCSPRSAMGAVKGRLVPYPPNGTGSCSLVHHCTIHVV